MVGFDPLRLAKGDRTLRLAKRDRTLPLPLKRDRTLPAIGFDPLSFAGWIPLHDAKGGQGRIELPTSPTLKENHTTRPLALLLYASTWARTRDLSVNSRALCQLSHGGLTLS